MSYLDIYYNPDWVSLYAERDHGEPGYYTFENEYGVIVYPHVKRVAPHLIKGEEYYDLITPYGFNGPCIVRCRSGYEQKLIQDYEEDFANFCDNNNIVTEYVRFSPWLKNHLHFGNYYRLKDNNKTVVVDLTVTDILMDEISSKRRNLIRKAMKSNVKIEFDFDGHSIKDFYHLYHNTIKKNDISEYYQFSLTFLEKHFRVIQGKVFIVNAVFDGDIISSGVFLHEGEHLHYHFSANDYGKTRLNGNSLMLLTVAEWGQRNGKKFLHLGGAPRSSDLMRFKLSFTRSEEGLPFYVGTRVRNQDVYNELVRLSDRSRSDYFPEYR